MASRDRQRRSQQNTFRITLCAGQIFQNAIGLCYAPGAFCRSMDVILSTMKWQFALVYLEDYMTFSENADEHISHVCTLLLLLQKAEVRFNLEKCNSFTEEIGYLVHGTQPGNLELPDQTADAIRDLKPLRNVAELKSCLGSCNIYLQAVPNFARIAAPLS